MSAADTAPPAVEAAATLTDSIAAPVVGAASTVSDTVAVAVQAAAGAAPDHPFLDPIQQFFDQLSAFVWGPFTLVLLCGTGIYLTLALKGLQFWQLIPALRLALVERSEKGDAAGDVSHFQALMTAMAATVGTGNIAGVAAAIVLGGPGAIFWMWVTGLVGMATKYAEAVLAVKFREVDANGNMCGGPMYYIWKGMGQKWLGILFAIFAVCASFGIGNMAQSNSVADVVSSRFGIATWVTGLVLANLTALVILGGIKTIARVTAIIVPFMVIFYTVGGLIILALHWRGIPDAFALIFRHAFQPMAGVGGVAGVMVMQAVRWGVARGVFSNEAGLGSAPIAAAAAKTRNPVRQALVSMTQTFIDTLIICSITALVILSTDVWTHVNDAGQRLTGAALTAAAFNHGLPGDWGGLIVAIGLIFFAYSTLVGWSYYGEKSAEFLFGVKAIMPYRIAFCNAILIGAVVKLDLVWAISDAFNGLMAIPNLIALLALSPIVIRETRKYLNQNPDVTDA